MVDIVMLNCMSASIDIDVVYEIDYVRVEKSHVKLSDFVRVRACIMNWV